MNPGKSTLNPHAEAYVPLSKREFPTQYSAKSPEVGSNDGIEEGLLPTGVASAQHFQHFQQKAEHHNMQHSPRFNLHGSSCQGQSELTDTQLMDMQFDSDMRCLRMNFHDTSEESLSYAYIASKCDLDETIDMLNQLELPDSLDIGDESEPGPSSEAANQKLKNKSVTGETSTAATSSGSSCSNPITE
ncbi:hypothetical protein DM860_000726 [Cuscuta australis]|uniref:CUE domain-containing protein n=1 Tax=Cuscuta australis TaxID=267555 RepID=A0A328CX40_9ASTE|nr:hypothetical protein DM860_000726 [Cuscuta australis]